MKRAIHFTLALAFMAFSSISYSQTEVPGKKEQRKIAKLERKQAAEERSTIAFEHMKDIIESGRYVLQADRLQNYNVQSELNYILVDNDESAVQTGNRFRAREYDYRSGWTNSIGGWTINGEIRNYEVKTIERRKSFIIKYDLYQNTGSSSVTIRVSAFGDASAKVRSNIGTSYVEFFGELISFEQSRIYKGPREL